MFAQLELLDLWIEAAVGVASLGVPFDDFFERLLAAVVHVRFALGHVANRWRLEGAFVLFVLRDAEQAVATVKGIPGYVAQFDKVFDGKDGSAVMIENIGKAIASFERVLVTSPSPYDYNEKLRSYGEVDEKELEKEDPDLYADYMKAKALAESEKMSDSAKRGRDIFFADNKGGCTACHVGANLSDELYHNIGVGMHVDEPDPGLFGHSKDETHKGAFKTPTIRNVEKSAPYMHDGSQKSLEEVVEWYAKGGHPNPGLDPKIKKLELSDQDKKDLVEFMKACSSAFPVVEKHRLPQ